MNIQGVYYFKGRERCKHGWHTAVRVVPAACATRRRLIRVLLDKPVVRENVVELGVAVAPVACQVRVVGQAHRLDPVQLSLHLDGRRQPLLRDLRTHVRVLRAFPNQAPAVEHVHIDLHGPHVAALVYNVHTKVLGKRFCRVLQAQVEFVVVAVKCEGKHTVGTPSKVVVAPAALEPLQRRHVDMHEVVIRQAVGQATAACADVFKPAGTDPTITKNVKTTNT